MARFVPWIVVGLLLLCRPAEGTWSIVLTDKVSKEVAIGSVTCLNNFDLRAITPVILAEVGGAAVQAAGDFDGIRRPVIYDGFLDGKSPEEILEMLATIGGHHQRQYGIVDTFGRAVTFTGLSAFRWAGGVTGEVGNIVYAIQGNILAGSCVVPAMENAILNTPGDIPAKLMAAMEVARVSGGD
ncbi:MAG: DUF1028 domain-containing protein, partial [Planctomycetota bacterium]